MHAEFPVPAGEKGLSFPFGITAGLDDNVWFTEQNANLITLIPL